MTIEFTSETIHDVNPAGLVQDDRVAARVYTAP